MKNKDFLTGLGVGVMLAFLVGFSLARIDSVKDYRVTKVLNDNEIVLTNVETNNSLILEIENSYSQAYEIGQIITIKY